MQKANTLIFEDDDEEMSSMHSFPRSFSSASSDSDSPYNFFSTRSPSNPPQRQQQTQQELFGLFERLMDRLQQTLKEGLEKQTSELKKIISDQPRLQHSGNSDEQALKKTYKALCEGAFYLLFQTHKRFDSSLDTEALREALQAYSLEFHGSRSQKLKELAKSPLTCPVLLEEASYSLTKQRHLANKKILASCGLCWPDALKLTFFDYLDSSLRKGGLEIGAGDASYSSSSSSSSSSTGDNTSAGTKRKYTKKRGEHEALLAARAAWKEFFDDVYTDTKIDPYNTWFKQACTDFMQAFHRKDGLTTSDWAYIAATVRLYLEGCHLQNYIYIARELYKWLLDVCNHHTNPSALQRFLESDKPSDRRSSILDWPLPVGLKKHIQSHFDIDEASLGRADSVDKHLAESLVPSAAATGRKQQQTAGHANRGKQANLNRTTSAPAGLMANQNAAREEEQEEEEEQQDQSAPLLKKRGRPPKSQSTANSSGKRPQSGRKSQASKLTQPPDSSSDSELEPEDEEEIGTAEAIAAGHAALTARRQKRKRNSATTSPPLKRRKTMV